MINLTLPSPNELLFALIERIIFSNIGFIRDRYDEKISRTENTAWVTFGPLSLDLREITIMEVDHATIYLDCDYVRAELCISIGPCARNLFRFDVAVRNRNQTILAEFRKTDEPIPF